MNADAPPEYPEELLRFVARFDRREYWLAHEELEELWQVDRQDFYKGLIQLAAAFVHIERGNWRGARRLLRTGLDYIASADARQAGFDVGALRACLGTLLARVSELAEDGDGELDESLCLTLAPLFAGEVAGDTVADVGLPYRVRRYKEGYRPIGARRKP